MTTPDRRFLPLGLFLLALLALLLPWTSGGRSPLGQVILVVPLCVAGAVALWLDLRGMPRHAAPILLVVGLPVGLSAWQSLYPDRSLQAILLLLAYALAGLLAACVAREMAWGADLLLGLLALSGALVAGVGTLRWWQTADSGLYAGTFTGPFGYPNAAAGFLLLAGGAALAAAVSIRHPAGRWITGGGSLGILASLALTRSRGAILAAIMGPAIGAILAVDGRRPCRRLMRWLLGSGLTGAAALLGTPLGPWLSDRFNPDDPSFVWRRRMLEITWDMIRDQPWLGFGPGAFPVAANLYQRLPYVGGQNPHNVYLEWGAELGLPMALLFCAGLAALLIRASRPRHALPPHLKRQLAVLVGTLIAFAVHCALDIDWSYPAIVVAAAIVAGVVAATSTEARHAPRPRPPLARLLVVGLLIGAATLAGARYGAGLLVARASQRAQRDDLSAAQVDLAWALRLNPLSFSAHQLLARTALRRGDPSLAAQAAERVARLNPADPNSLALAGEVAGAAGRWDQAEAWFRRAAELAPAAQLRFHTGLVEAAVRAGHLAEGRLAYARAVTIFSPDQVLSEEARCLAPGDRYLLARTARLLEQSAAEPGHSPNAQPHPHLVDALAAPDRRAICNGAGEPGRRSPEETAISFLAVAHDRDPSRAARLLSPSARTLPWWIAADGSAIAPQPQRLRLARIHQLDANEERAALRYTLGGGQEGSEEEGWCAITYLIHTKNGWVVDRSTTLTPGPCAP